MRPRASFALIMLVVIGCAALMWFADDGVTPSTSAAFAYALVKRIGVLSVTFYLAHAAVGHYRYTTLRATHYRACAQAITVCDSDDSLLAVYRMLLPPHAFGSAPTSPVDALVKIAANKGAGE